MKTGAIKQHQGAHERAGAGTEDRPIKLADSETLRLLNRTSIRKGYDRNLTDEFFARLDPQGAHVLSVLMVHEHARMRPVPPHYRCQVLAKYRGRTQPVFVILDIPFESFDSLPDARPPVPRIVAGASASWGRCI